MKLNDKSAMFAEKILEHYPLEQKASSQGENKEKPIQPYAHMHDHRKQRQIYERPTKEKLQNMKYFKEQGNNKYREQKFDEAAYFYQKVIIYSDYTFPEKSDEQNQFQILVQQSNMNLAICLIKKKNWENVEMHLKQAEKGQIKGKSQKQREKIINTRKKSLYWQIKNQIRKGNFNEAQKIVERLSKIGNCAAQVQELKEQLTKKKSKGEEDTKNLSKKMLA